MVGKSPSSIRRIIYPIVADDQHPDRHHVQPGVDEARALRLKGESFPWRISEELLLRESPPDSSPRKGSGDNSHRPSDDSAELVAILRKELEIKNEQITQQSTLMAKQIEIFNGLSERLREGNILIASLQQTRSLSGREADMESAASSADATRTAKPQPAKKSDKGSGRAAKVGKPKSWLREILTRPLF